MGKILFPLGVPEKTGSGKPAFAGLRTLNLVLCRHAAYWRMSFEKFFLGDSQPDGDYPQNKVD